MKCEVCSKLLDNTYNYNRHIKKCILINDIKNVVRDDYSKGFSMKELSIKYKISPNTVNFIVKDISRSLSDAVKLARSKYTEIFKHSDKTKEKLRIARLNYLKENYEKTAWFNKTNSNMSFGEKYIHNLFKEYNMYTKYDIVNEFHIHPYIIDFAFINEKIAVEFDGKVHFEKGQKRIDHDIKKDEYLISIGWKVFRIPYYNLYTFKISDLTSFIGNPISKNYGDYLIEYSKYKQSLIKTIKTKQKQEKFKQIELIKTNLLNSNIDFNKFGWVNKASKIINIAPQKVNKWMKHNMEDFYKTCYKRNINNEV